MKQLKSKVKELEGRIRELNLELDKAKQELEVIIEAWDILDRDSVKPEPSKEAAKPPRATPKPKRSPKKIKPRPSKVARRPHLKAVKIIKGDKTIKEGTNMSLSIKALRSRSPNWMRPGGIAEAIIALGLKKAENVTKNYPVVLSSELKRLREGGFNVPGFEFHLDGKIAEYRIASDSEMGKHSK